MNTWQVAWLFSSIMFGTVFIFANKGGFSRVESTLLATVWFPSPLFYAVGGSNSVVYLLDFLTPVAIYFGIKQWKYSPKNIRNVFISLIFSIGFMPVFTAVGYAVDRVTFLLAFINLYRVLGALYLMVYFSSFKAKIHIKESYVMTGFALASIVIVTAMIFQGTGYLNSNILETVRAATTSFKLDESGIDEKFIVLGMFRGSLGIIGLLGVALSITKFINDKKYRVASLLSGISGIAVIVLSGSKTSLVCVAAIMVWSLISQNLFSKNTIVIVAIVVVLQTSVSYISSNKYTKEYIPPLLYSAIVGSSDSTVTAESRLNRYEKSLAALNKHPEILTGFVSTNTYRNLDSSEVNLTYFHNEYLSVFMLGGILSVTSYLVGLYYLAKSLFLSKSRYLAFQNLASLLFVGCIIQGLTVAHLQPGFLFPITVGILCSIYGLASIPVTN